MSLQFPSLAENLAGARFHAELSCDSSAMRLPGALYACGHKNSHRPIQASLVSLSVLNLNVSLFLDDRIEADNVLDVAHRLHPNALLAPEILY